jgi:hypothetical protein
MPTPWLPADDAAPRDDHRRLAMTISPGRVGRYYQANLRWLPKAGTAASPAHERGDARQPKGAT